MSWRLAKSLERLRNQVNSAASSRSKVSDGSIGDTAHSSRASDHNPNTQGVVCAIDITHDPRAGVDGGALSQALITDPRVKYIIFSARIWKARTGRWEAYRGANAHQHHVHVSVQANRCDDISSWPWPPLAVKTSPQVIGTTSAPAFTTSVASPSVSPQLLPTITPETGKSAESGTVAAAPDSEESSAQKIQKVAQSVGSKVISGGIPSGGIVSTIFLVIWGALKNPFVIGAIILGVCVLGAWLWNESKKRQAGTQNKLIDAAASKEKNTVAIVPPPG